MKRMVLFLMLMVMACTCACAQELPSYRYTGADPVERAVCDYIMESGMGERFALEENAVTIPAPVILRTVWQNDTHMLVYGDFWVFNYVVKETVLECISGGEFPGILHLEMQDGAWKGVSLEEAGSGDDYAADIQRFCAGDKELEDMYFAASDAAQPLVRETRTRLIRDYVRASGLAIEAYQDPYWESIPLEEAKGESRIRGEILEGSYVIRVELDPNRPGEWAADELLGKDQTVRFGSVANTAGAYTVRYDPVADGEATVSMRHFDGIACDEIHTFDLLVRDGKIAEVTGGSWTAAPDEEELDAYLSGSWLEKETQFTSMTLEKNSEKGWKAEIASPMSHGAFVFRANVYYDCELDALVYDDGVLCAVTAEGGETAPEQTGLKGRLLFTGDGESLALTWSDEAKGEDILLVRTAE